MRLLPVLTELYGEHANSMLAELSHLLNIPPANNDQGENPEWYKRLQLYVVYPEAFQQNGLADFSTLTQNLEYIEKLGCNAIHILPFFDSPLIDRGFDIRDYQQVRADLGGNEEFERFLVHAQEKKLSVFMDLVLNHTSDQHTWFQLAENGSEFFRQYYITQPQKPQLLRQFEDETGIWAEYQLESTRLLARVIFPDQSQELPHWRVGKDGHWYYHTFYSAQPDLNWSNPEVFLTMAEVVLYWARKGLQFRLDAIPFLGKDIQKGEIESGIRTHLIIEALHLLMKSVAPSSNFLVEACQPLTMTKEYFGQRSPEAEFAYSFRLMQGMWASLLSGNSTHVWEAVQELHPIPEWAQWITFLRNHDELTLEFADDSVRLLIYEALQQKGLPFRAGFGLSGRTASFLRDTQKVVTAYFLLASLPGVPAIIYGDELAKHNDEQYMQQQTALREHLLGRTVGPDTRDSNRGQLSERDRTQPLALRTYYAFSQIFNTRQRFPFLATQIPEPLPRALPVDIFGAQYTEPNRTLTVLINLGDEPFRCQVQPNAFTELTINGAEEEDGSVHLPPGAGIWLSIPAGAPCCLLE